MKRTEDLFHLTLIARRGARLVSNLVIEDTDEYFQTKVKVCSHCLPLVPSPFVQPAHVFIKRSECRQSAENMQALILSVNEKFLKSGEPAKYPRRDLRRGKLEGRFSLSKEGNPVITCVISFCKKSLVCQLSMILHTQ
jgi:hypothetical protein